jgi:hypothetical protein
MVELRTARRVMTATELQVIQEATRDTIAAGHMPGPDTWLRLVRYAEQIATPALGAARHGSALEDRHRYVNYQGERLPLAEWSRRTGIKSKTLLARLRCGWTVEQVLTTPVRLRLDVGDLVRRYQDGATILHLSRETGAARLTIRRHLVDAGVTLRPTGYLPGKAPARRRPPELVAAIVAGYQAGVSIADLAVKHHRHPSTVGRYLAEAGIPIVPPARPPRDVAAKEPELSPGQEADLFSLYAAGTHTSAELADKFGISLAAVYRAIKQSLAKEVP